MLSSSSGKSAAKPPKIWWTNAFFFVSVHLAAAVGAFYRPPSTVKRATLAMTFVLWQLGSLGYVCAVFLLYARQPKFP
jgi:stearoyl-CoA desaturase (Delta-9 desaturase)